MIRGSRMSDAQRRSYERAVPEYSLAPGEPIDFVQAFGNDHPVTVEIGFGMGRATAELGERNRLINYLGIEVHRPGIGRLLWEIERRGLTNIRIIEQDAVEVLSMLIPPCSLGALHIFFPDPWPKKRHHKRRLVKRPFTDILAQALKPQGYLYMATDWEAYAASALEALSNTPLLTNAYAMYAAPQPWRPTTAFEEKGRSQARSVWELYFIRSDVNKGGTA